MKYNHTQLRIGRLKGHVPRSIIMAGLIVVLLAIIGGVWWKQQSMASQASVQIPPPLQGDTVAPIHNAYGIAAGSSLTNADSQTINTRLDGMAALGVKWIRLDFDWSVIQPDNSQTFDWSQYDTIVTAAKQRHMYVLGILAYTPEWARASACLDSVKCHPADPNQFAAFAVAAATRYASEDVHYWEIWNEPNSPDFWQPKSDPTAYTQLLKSSYAALKQQDPKAYIITGGLSAQATTSNSYAPIDFLTGVYHAGAKGSFDAVGDHPYTFPLSPTSSVDHAWNQMAAVNASLRQTMITNGDSDKKIWITEFGAPTGGPGPISTIDKPNLDQHPYVVDEALQKKIMLDALTLYKSYDWAGPFFWYSYQDAGDTQDTNENFFGLLRYNGSPKPTYDAYKSWISANQ